MVDAKQVFRELKLHGLTLHSDALKRLLSELTNQPTLVLEDVVFAIKNSIDRSKLKTSVVTQDALESALDTLLNVSSDNDYQCIQVFNAFEQPKLVYHPSTKSYEVSADPSRKLHASSTHRLSLYRERFAALERRVLRHKSFAKPVASTTRQYNFQDISRIESLLGVTGTKRVLGMLGQDERKRVYLEDMTSRIYLDVSEAKFTNGIFTSSCIVLVEGQVLDDVFHVETIGSPPPELREQSLHVLSGVDALGVEVSTQQLAQIKQLESEQELDCFVVLSDVHLDEPDVLKRLDALFSGYEPFTPTLFIFMGNFTSTRVGYGYGAESTTIRTLKQLFDDLATLILKYPALVEKSQFLFVPGPNDPGAPDVVPRHAVCRMGRIVSFGWGLIVALVAHRVHRRLYPTNSVCNHVQQPLPSSLLHQGFCHLSRRLAAQDEQGEFVSSFDGHW
ncbi:hypothetical protein, variant 2 [Aphanomyces invadans]|uniref:DNA polymerase II subunit 2 n=1 Tax=Aphanomyces invadans TaxID=157072 RepID=A0A024TM45_9STRA|nr:hypothetical protein, variant 1 [Aphanomyces invadans]XP_008875932.1 hypothetical protein, variant 2 [Aphanomyces invadans]ETV95230.1 hypothetical protein, variant 1 [Aphanomyces invadans]ETV95231.1 hypothetical protein, variant 2 [Aphanomyces invadans]|eukprot:XP_008875931.1 hypothetical protein, variant 1 [Aphanomyces invadans]